MENQAQPLSSSCRTPRFQEPCKNAPRRWSCEVDKVKEALSFKCPYCEDARLGGTSSKQIPPASLRPLPRAWEQVGLDIGEWTVPNFDRKIKFILFIDMATRYKVTESLFDYAHGEVKIENADMVIQAITLRWLMDKPRPHVLIPDNAKSLMSQKFVDFMMEMGVEVIPPPDQESWAHGIGEGHQLDQNDCNQDPHVHAGFGSPFELSFGNKRFELKRVPPRIHKSSMGFWQTNWVWRWGATSSTLSSHWSSTTRICSTSQQRSNCWSLRPKGKSSSGLLQAEEHFNPTTCENLSSSPTCDGLEEVSSCDTIQR